MPLEKDQYSPYQTNALKAWEQTLAANKETLRAQFKKIIERYKFENLKNLSDREKNTISLVFFHGVDTYNFVFHAETLEGEELTDIVCKGSLFPEFEFGTVSSFLYPEDLDVYLEEYRDMQAREKSRQLFFTWFAKNWMECGGHKIGTISYTIENSVVNIFNLNELKWDFDINTDEGGKIDYPFVRDLTEYEISQRVGGGSPRGRFRTVWRYFEKEDTFLETGTYNEIVYIRSGKMEEFSTKSFQSFDNFKGKVVPRKELIAFYDKLINTGFYEKERPAVLPKLHKDLIEWDGHLATPADFIPVSEADFTQFEMSHKIEFPRSYKWFISHVNNGKITRNFSHFRIAKGEWKKFIKIFDFHRIAGFYQAFHAKHGLDKSLIPIASSVEKGVVLLHAKHQRIFYFSPEKGLLETPYNFENFIGNCTDISSYFRPNFYHLEQRNLITVKSLFENGLQLADIATPGKRSILQDIQSDIELTRFLLEQGADPNNIYLYADYVSKEYIEMMISYGMDFKSKLEDEERQHLQKQFLRREGFKEFIQQYLD